MTQLYLIRHGANDWVGKRLAGWTPGVHLSDEGRQQAAGLVARLAQIPIEAIYASPLERTLETAQPLAEAKGLAVQVRDDLGEVHYGDWTGQALEELAKTEEWQGVQFFPSNTRFPKGETLREAQARAVGQIERLRAAHPKGIVAVVSHADIIKTVVAHYLGLHLDIFQRIVISPASVTVFQFHRFAPFLVHLNDTGVLEPPEAEKAAEAPQPDGTEAAADTSTDAAQPVAEAAETH